MGTPKNPGKFRPSSTLDDEPEFILLGRDLAAPSAIRQWANKRQHMMKVGLAPKSDEAMVAEALLCAAEMETWRRNANEKWRGGKKRAAS